MNYISTRDSKIALSSAEAIVKGISTDGGLFVPSSFPHLSQELIDSLLDMDYNERTAKILSLYLEDFSYEELLGYVEKAYSKFDGDPCPLTKIEDNLYVLELWHGPTFAFKDMALTLLPYLLTASKKKLGIDEHTLVLVATSGDTGKAALEGFKDVDGTSIMVFYPNQGVSEMQKLQMMTAEGKNVNVVSINGNFDDAQTAVKSIFNNKDIVEDLKSKKIAFSSANSINWGRLAPQIAYYISAYLDLVGSENFEYGDKVNFVVPTGNFGNILAGYYAYKMGLPIGKLIIASNANNVLTDFFESGVYDINRDFFKTMSPSMDILISSNLERFCFELFGRDDTKLSQIYNDLKTNCKFEIDLGLLNSEIFEAGWADEQDTFDAIKNFFEYDDYIFDTHTAVGASVYNDYSIETNDETPTVLVSTASPYKFVGDVLYAISGKRVADAKKAMLKLQMMTALDCPSEIYYLDEKAKLHTSIIDKDTALQAVWDYANKIANKN